MFLYTTLYTFMGLQLNKFTTVFPFAKLWNLIWNIHEIDVLSFYIYMYKKNTNKIASETAKTKCPSQQFQSKFSISKIVDIYQNMCMWCWNHDEQIVNLSSDLWILSSTSLRDTCTCQPNHSPLRIFDLHLPTISWVYSVKLWTNKLKWNMDWNVCVSKICIICLPLQTRYGKITQKRRQAIIFDPFDI